MSDRLAEIRSLLSDEYRSLRPDREDGLFLLAELDAAQARLAACEQERDIKVEILREEAERYQARLAKAEEALREIGALQGYGSAYAVRLARAALDAIAEIDPPEQDPSKRWPEDLP